MKEKEAELIVKDKFPNATFCWADDTCCILESQKEPYIIGYAKSLLRAWQNAAAKINAAKQIEKR